MGWMGRPRYIFSPWSFSRIHLCKNIKIGSLCTGWLGRLCSWITPLEHFPLLHYKQLNPLLVLCPWTCPHLWYFRLSVLWSNHYFSYCNSWSLHIYVWYWFSSWRLLESIHNCIWSQCRNWNRCQFLLLHGCHLCPHYHWSHCTVHC